VVSTHTKLPDPDDTIVALSSAAGPAVRAVVRLSGRRSAVILASLCPDFDKDSLPPRHFFRASLHLPGFHARIPTEIYYFVAPRTYTGQDVIEIHTLACQPIVDVLIAECLNAGARAAQPGEFTMRAFLAGKLDLTRAEAVLGVIEAANRQELKQALTQLAGGVAQPLRELREDLLNLLADVEAALDFADEDIHFVSVEAMLKRLAKGLAYVTLLSKQIEQRSLGQRPFRVVLAGPPNAGKSSLFNALAGTDAALVSAEPGTTRDYLEQIIDVDEVAIQLVDTAGWRETADAIEADAQSLGKEQTDHADLVLWCHPCDEPISPGPTLSGIPCWQIATKADLVSAYDAGLATSITTGQGLEELRTRVAQHVRRSGHAAMAPSLSRCRHHLDACLQYLRHAHSIVLNQEMPELLALELRLTLDELGALVGAVYTDDLLDRIFSRFCIGK
jgi:tRNA modification GTPase